MAITSSNVKISSRRRLNKLKSDTTKDFSNRNQFLKTDISSRLDQELPEIQNVNIKKIMEDYSTRIVDLK